MGVPYGLLDFVQGTGRGGRDGERVQSLLLATEEEVKRTLHVARPSKDEKAPLQYIEAVTCRRKIISQFLDAREDTCLAIEA
ncbi:MAG: hypothetical protein M1823_009087, partial [Watsoniomyces obsoletus]